MKKRSLCLLSLLVAWAVWMIGTEGLSAADEVRVRLLPFQVFSAQEDADELRVLIERLIFASLLGEGTIRPIHLPDEAAPPEGYTEARAREVAELDDAAWVLWGSLTQAGRLLSVDLRLMAVEAGQPSIPLYMEAASREEMLSRVEEEMERALSKILQRPKIVEIRVEGNRRIGKDAILLRAKSRTGDDYSPYRLRKDIRDIDKMGYFEDVRLLVEDAKGGKVVTFVVEEKPSIREVVVTGNDKISTDDIQEAITLQPQSILNYQVLQDTVEKIKKLYQEKGYYGAKVSYELRDLEGNQKGVILQIEEGKKFWIKTITFEGNEHFSDKKLKKVMESKEKDWLHWFTSSGVLDQETLRQDTERLAAYYYDHGFIRCRIGSPKIENDEEWIYITIGVEEGEQYTISSIRLEGDLIEEEDLMKASLMLKEKEPFNRGLLRSDILKLTERYADQGYAYAEVKPATQLNDADRTVDVTLNIKKKQKVRIGRIRIMGNTKTRDKVIRREMVLSEGDTFSSMALKESNKRLHALKYFEEMNITTSPGVSDEVIDLNVEVKEQQTGTFSLGAGYSSIDQIIGVAEINQTNLFGRGYKVRLKAEVGSRKQFYDFSFVNPWFLDTRVGLRVDAYNTEREYDSYTRAALGGNIMFYFPLDRFLANLTGQVGYRLENVEVSDVDKNSATVFRLSEGESLTSQVLGGLTYDTRDNAVYPNRGNISQLGVGFAGLGGDNRFGKYRINSAQYFPIKWGTVFMTRGEFGYGHGWGDEELPVFERFFLGGMHSIRGFEAGAVGPVDPKTGDVVGGDTMLFFNFEYIFPIVKKLELRGLVFYDTGNAWLGKIDLTDMRHALGVGVRWYSPFGPLRVEIGFNLDPRRDEKPFEWGFGMGGSF